MKPLNINFATPGAIARLLGLSWFQRGAILCCAIALIGTIHLYIGLLGTSNSLQSHIADIQKQLFKYQKPEAPAREKISNAEIGTANQIITQLNFPWSEILDEFEKLTPAEIALLSIEPSPKKDKLRAEAEAKSPDTMLSYLNKLSAESKFDDVVLIHHAINEQDVNRPLRFQFEATWKQKEK